MFHNIPSPVLFRMKFLEEVDMKDRTDGTPRMQRLDRSRPKRESFSPCSRRARLKVTSSRSARARGIRLSGSRSPQKQRVGA